MSRFAFPEAGTARVRPMSQAQLHVDRVRDGDHVRTVRGRSWAEYGRGFFEPVHLLDRLPRADVRRPGVCWGFRAALREADAGWANGSIPLHLMTDVAGYGWDRLPGDSRRYLKKFDQHDIRLVSIDDPAIFHDQGYAVFLDWRDRVIGRESPPPSEEVFLRRIDRIVENEGWLLLAGIDAADRLLGYMTAWAVEDTAHLQDSKITTEALRTRLGIALDHTALQVLQASGGIRQVTAGLHTPEHEALTTYKLRHGFEVVHVPARVSIPAPIGWLLQRWQPGRWYRLTGRSAPLAEAPETPPDA